MPQIQDQNAGALFTPQGKQASGTFQTQGPLKGIDKTYEGASALAGAFAGVLEETQAGELAEIQARKRLVAAGQSGSEKGKREIAEDQRRTPFLKAVFGDDPEQVISRRLEDKDTMLGHTNKIKSDMQAYGSMPPADFHAVMQKSQEDALKDYTGTSVEKEALIAEFETAGKELHTLHEKEWAGYVAVYNRGKDSNIVRKQFDAMALDSANGITSPEQAKEFQAKVAKVFDIEQREPGQDRKSWIAVRMEEVAYSLSKGNIGAYRAAKDNGLFDKATKAQRGSLDTAKTKYENEVTQEHANVIEQGQYDMNEATSIAGVEEVYTKMLQDLTILEQRSADFTPKGMGDVLKNKTAGQLNRFTALNRFKDSPALKAAKKAAAKKQVAAEKLEEDKATILARQGEFGVFVPETNAGLIPPPDKKSGTAAVDSILTDWINKTAGEEVDPKEGMLTILQNPALLGKSVHLWKQNPYESNVVNTLFSAILDSDLSGFTDESGQLKPEINQYIGAMDKFQKANPGKFKQATTQMGVDRFEALKQSINAGHSVDRANKDWADTKQKLLTGTPTYSPQYVDGKPMTKAQHVASFIGGKGEFPTATEVSNMIPIYNRGLILGDGDSKYAQQYVEDHRRNAVTSIKLGNNSMTLEGGKNLEERLNLETPLEKLLQYHDSKDLFTEFVFALEGDTRGADKKNQTPKTKLSDVENLQMYTVIGYDGLFINNPLAPNPIAVPSTQIQDWDRQATQQRNAEALRREKFALAEAESPKGKAFEMNKKQIALGTTQY